MTISAAISNLQSKLSSLGVKIPPGSPPEAANAYPFGVSYLSNGNLDIQSQGWAKNFHTIFTEIHVSRQLLPAAIDQAMSYIEPFFLSLMADPTLDYTISNIVEVRHKFGKLEWGKIQTIGIRFEIDVKILLEDSVLWYLKENVQLSECVAAYRGKGAADIATSQINLANPGVHDLVGSPTPPAFDPLLGWIGNSAQKYWYTDIMVDAADWTFIVKFNSLYVNSTSGCLFGYSQISPFISSLYIQPSITSYIRIRYFSDVATMFPVMGEGVLAMANRTGYRIGLYGLTSFSIPSPIYPIGTLPIWLCGVNNGSTGSNPINGIITSFAVYNKELSSTQVYVIGQAMP